MQITLNESELHEAVQLYIIGLGILAEGTNASVSLTGGGGGKTNSEYGATLEFTKSPRRAEAVEKAVKTVEQTPVVALSDNSETLPQDAGTASPGKSSVDTQGSSQEPDLTKENPENGPYNDIAAEGPASKGVSLFNRQTA